MRANSFSEFLQKKGEIQDWISGDEESGGSIEEGGSKTDFAISISSHYDLPRTKIRKVIEDET